MRTSWFLGVFGKESRGLEQVQVGNFGISQNGGAARPWEDFAEFTKLSLAADKEITFSIDAGVHLVKSQTTGNFSARALRLAFMVVAMNVCGLAMAKKGVEAVYEDPFDLGGGGASLTRASKEGRVFANPAQLAYGGKFHRWLGFTFSVLANKESIDTARTIVANAQNQTTGASPNGTSSDEETTEFIDKVFAHPVRAGWGFALSWLTGAYGLSVFSRFEPDIRARYFGDFGVPELRFAAESYHGVALGVPIRTPWSWLSFGLTGKYLYAAEPDFGVAISDQDKIEEMASPDFIQDLAEHNVGLGFDLGLLLFFQGKHFDLSIAGKVDDLGATQLKGESENPTHFKQVVSAGAALALHTGADVVHFAVDVRDLANSYQNANFKKIYAGTKIILRTYLGLSAGYYHGYPSFGTEVDLLLMRVALTAYTRELGDNPGVDPRRIYMASMSVGG